MIFSMKLSWQVLLGSLLTVAQAKSQSSKVSLYVGSMAPLTGGRSWWGAGITTAMQMAFELINNRSDILPYFELKLLENDTRGETGLGNKILYDYISKQRPSLILGPGRSNVALSVADTAKYWKIIQMSASAESGDLSNSNKYPYFFRTIGSISASKSAFVALAKTFHWKRVSILFFSRDMYMKAASDLKDQCEQNNITVKSYGSYADTNDAENQLKHIKDIDARIIFAFLQKTTSVMCLVYKHKLYGNKYGWVVHTPDAHGWWTRTYPFLDCTASQVNDAAAYTIHIDHLYLSKSKDPTISGLTPRQFLDNYEAFSKRKNTSVSHYGPFGFDAAWLVALAINMSNGESSNVQLLDIKTDYSSSDMIKNSLLKTNFKGVTGEVQLQNNGDRTGMFEVFQIRGKDLEVIALYDALNADNLTYYGNMKFKWRDGRSPRDHIVYKAKLIQLSRGNFIVICVLCSLGIILCLGFLHFNIMNRTKRCVKMSSPNINNAIIVGCFLAYCSAILFAVDGDKLTNLICKARVITLDIGFTVAFGSLFSKTWRVHRITRKIKVRRRVIKDIHLFGMIFVFLFVDIVLIIVWTIMDPLRKDEMFLADKAEELHADVIYRPVVSHCTTNKPFVWLLVVYGFKGILLIFGLFLAWETRKVKIVTLNDSHYIGMAVYNVFIVCAIGVPVALFGHRSHQYEFCFYVITSCIVFCTTLTLCLVFVPKMRTLKKRNSEEVCGRFPTNHVIRGNEELDVRLEGLPNIELQEEVKRLKSLLEELQKGNYQGFKSHQLNQNQAVSFAT